jgi:thymidine kinase
VQFPVLVTELLPAPDEMEAFDAIGVDEAQRFDWIAEWADRLANAGKIVEVSALDGNYEREPFRNIVEVVSVCERLQKLDSICPITGFVVPFSAIRDGVSMPVSRVALMHGMAMAPRAVLTA